MLRGQVGCCVYFAHFGPVVEEKIVGFAVIFLALAAVIGGCGGALIWFGIPFRAGCVSFGWGGWSH